MHTLLLNTSPPHPAVPDLWWDTPDRSDRADLVVAFGDVHDAKPETLCIGESR